MKCHVELGFDTEAITEREAANKTGGSCLVRYKSERAAIVRRVRSNADPVTSGVEKEPYRIRLPSNSTAFAFKRKCLFVSNITLGLFLSE